MFIFEFKDGSIINLLTIESLNNLGDNNFNLTTISGTKYRLDINEFNAIKQIIEEKLKNN